MTTIFGVPVVGSAFFPVSVAAVILFLIWNFVSKKHVQSTELTENGQHEHNSTGVFEELRGKENLEQKKSCSKKKGCCGSGKKKLGSCSPKTGPIESLKVITSSKSSLCLELEEILSQGCLKSNLRYDCDVKSTSDIKALLENKTGGMSLCTFLLNSSENDDIYLWLKEAVTDKTCRSKLLGGIKYAVFSLRNESEESSSFVLPDQWLHRLGGVRVCKAGTANMESSNVLNDFHLWMEELFDHIMRWNEPKNKVCKCGPKDEKDSCEKETYSGGSSCSDSDVDVEDIDLEDIGRVLNFKNPK